MKKIPISHGKLYISPLPCEEDLVGYEFDIIWNLAHEANRAAEWQKKYATIVLLGNIEDYDVPKDIVGFKSQLDCVVGALRHNRSVLVHCLGGHGRTGMAVACILNKLEFVPVIDALKTTKRICYGPEVQEQIEFVYSVCKE